MDLKLAAEDLRNLSVPLQLAASTIITGFIGMKIGGELHEAFGEPLGLLIGLIVGFFGYVAVIIKKEQ
jgi:F0F1-type ATP synthase assembly protein I